MRSGNRAVRVAGAVMLTAWLAGCFALAFHAARGGWRIAGLIGLLLFSLYVLALAWWVAVKGGNGNGG